MPDTPTRRAPVAEIAALGLAVLVLIFGAAWLVGFEGVTETPESAGSSESSGPRGTLALYRYLERTGFSVSRARGNDAFPPDADTLFMINPSGDFREGAAGSIRLWVEEGNTLVLTLGQELGDISTGLGAEQHPMLREFDIEHRFTGSYSATVPLAQPLPGALPVSRVRMPGEFTLEPPPGSVVFISTREGDEHLPLAAMIPAGEGRVFVLATDYPLSNLGLGEADNGALAYNLAGFGGGRRVAFDEVHHNPSTGGDLIGIITGAPWGWALIYAAALSVIYVVWSARRLGPPLPVRSPDMRRPTSDYVRSVARLFRRARKPDYAAGEYTRHMKRTLARHAGMDPGTPDERFVPLFTERGRFPVDPAKMDEAMRELADISTYRGGTSVEDDALAAIREAERLRREALGLRE
jgi:hypothetical protein